MGGWSETEGRCKKHPSHKQSSGVCPSCLREKLSHLSASTNAPSSSSLISSPYSPGFSSSSSSSSSPARRGKMVAMSTVLLGAGKVKPLTKSRSMAFLVTAAAAAAAKEEGKAKGGKGSSRGGFWTRLLVGNGRKRREGESDHLAALHSQTVRATASARWIM